MSTLSNIDWKQTGKYLVILFIIDLLAVVSIVLIAGALLGALYGEKPNVDNILIQTWIPIFLFIIRTSVYILFARLKLNNQYIHAFVIAVTYWLINISIEYIGSDNPVDLGMIIQYLIEANIGTYIGMKIYKESPSNNR